MKTLLLLLSGLLLTTTLHADVLVYKNKITLTVTGGGTVTKWSVTGWTILDMESADTPVMLLAYPKLKKFQRLDLEDCQVDQVTGAKLATLTVISQASAWPDSSGFNTVDVGAFKGINVSVTPASIGTTGNTNNWTIPKTFTWTGSSIYPNENQEPLFEQSTGTLALDLTWSKTCNTMHDDAEAAFNRLKAFLQSQLYTEL